LGGLFIILNLLLYIFQIIFIILWVTSNEDRDGNPVYEANIIADVILSVAVSTGFFIYGWLLFFLTKKVDDVGVGQRDKELTRILLITLVFTACFSIRVFMFLYRPITGRKFSEPLFYSLAYYVPEVLPTLLQVYLAETLQDKQEKDIKYIENLYAESQDSIDDYREINYLIKETENTRLVS